MAVDEAWAVAAAVTDSEPPWRRGTAGVNYAWWQEPCQARASIGRDGTALVASAATDIGTGT